VLIKKSLNQYILKSWLSRSTFDKRYSANWYLAKNQKDNL